MLPIYDRAHQILGRKLFAAPMSRDARNILDTVIEAILNRTGLSHSQLLEKFATGYHPAIYEDAVLGWDQRALKKAIESSKLFKQKKKSDTDDEIAAIALLQPLYNRVWTVPMRSLASFRFSASASHTEAYDYLTTQYLLEDFSQGDLVKLSEIAKSFPIETVKDACRKIEAPDKRHIAYLYRVLKNEEVISDATNTNIRAITDRSMEAIKAALDISVDNKFKAEYDPNWANDIKATRKMYEDD